MTRHQTPFGVGLLTNLSEPEMPLNEGESKTHA